MRRTATVDIQAVRSGHVPSISQRRKSCGHGHLSSQTYNCAQHFIPADRLRRRLNSAVSHYRGSIVADHLQKSRRQVLVRLESILGNACYNANIQNYGPGGIREAEGRSFRYPLTLRLSDGSKQKVSSGTIPDSVSDDALRSGYYAFGANQLDVISALDRMLKYLEQHHDLVIANGG